MVSFRYYLVTIVAIFLALGLGVLAGTTVIDQGLVNSLKARTDALQVSLDDSRSAIDQLQRQLGQMDDFADRVVPIFVQGRLVGTNVVVVVQQGVDADVRSRAIDSMGQAGAEIRAVITVGDRMSSIQPGARADLADALGVRASMPATDLIAEASQRLARRLAEGGDSPIGDQRGNDLLDSLRAGELIEIESAGGGAFPGSIEQIGVGNQVVVVIAGGQNGSVPDPSQFFVPLVDSLTRYRVEVAAAQGLDARPGFVPRVRDGDLGNGQPILTVDDVDRTIGGLALVVGLQRLVQLGEGGNYGVQPGTDLVPPLESA